MTRRMQIKTIDNEPRVSTLDLYEGFGLTHNAIMQTIRKYKRRFEKRGVLDFKNLKPTSRKGGRPITYCFLNEHQAYALCTVLRNTDRVLDMKFRLTDEFMRMKKFIITQLHNKANAEWREARKNGKDVRRIETDALQRFVAYAKTQGSRNAEKYYINVSRMQNRALFFIDQKFKNIRNLLDVHQLMTVAVADRIVVRALEKGMDSDLEYKDIYRLAKAKIEEFADLHGKTPVPALQIGNQQQIPLLR